MWELTSEERRQLAKGGDQLGPNLQTKKQLFSIYKEESALRKRFEEVLNCYDEDGARRNSSGVAQRMNQALAERRRYFSVNAPSNNPGKKLSLPNLSTSPRFFEKSILKPMERTFSDDVKFGNFPALSFSQQNDSIKGASLEVTDVEVQKEGTSVNREKALFNDISVSMESPRSFAQQKRGPLQKDRFISVESESPRIPNKTAIQPSRKARSLSFPISPFIRPVHRGTRGRRIGFASSWKTRLHRRPYLVIP